MIYGSSVRSPKNVLMKRMTGDSPLLVLRYSSASPLPVKWWACTRRPLIVDGIKTSPPTRSGLTNCRHWETASETRERRRALSLAIGIIWRD